MEENKWMLVGFIVVAFLFVILLAGLNQATITAGMNVVAALVLINFLRHRYPERYKKDERTVRLSGYAASWSVIISFLFVALLFWADYLGLLMLSTGQTLGLIFFFMLMNIFAFRWYFFRKADA